MFHLIAPVVTRNGTMYPKMSLKMRLFCAFGSHLRRVLCNLQRKSTELQQAYESVGNIN